MIRMLATAVAFGMVLVTAGCSKSPTHPAATEPPVKAPGENSTTVAKTKTAIPAITEQQRQELITYLTTCINEKQRGLDDLIQATAKLAVITELAPEQATKLREVEQKGKEAREQWLKELIEFSAIRNLAAVSTERQQGLVERIVDRYREKNFPMYDLEFVREKVGNGADQPAAQLAQDVSNKVVFGFHERYDAEWMVNDAEEFTKQRIDEIVDGLASTPKR
ncbi:MAG: hypothetical protein WD872_17125 [Pirellulaceae bacterium]